jgi:lipoate-protein ligase B
MHFPQPNGGARFLDVRRLGRTDYRAVHDLQLALVAERAEDRIGDTLLLTEHDPVVTVGRGSAPEGVGELSLPVIEVERGGEATYHGPGQLVAYAILKLPEERRDLHRYLRDLEEVVIGVLGEFQLAGERREGRTGVWLAGRKICSIGVAVRRWVTYHGLALNLHTDLEGFRGFKPCGLDPDVMTRLADHVELPPSNMLGEVLLVKHFTRVFRFELPPPAAATSSDERFPPLPLL